MNYSYKWWCDTEWQQVLGQPHHGVLYNVQRVLKLSNKMFDLTYTHAEIIFIRKEGNNKNTKSSMSEQGSRVMGGEGQVGGLKYCSCSNSCCVSIFFISKVMSKWIKMSKWTNIKESHVDQ